MNNVVGTGCRGYMVGLVAAVMWRELFAEAMWWELVAEVIWRELVAEATMLLKLITEAN